MGVQRTKWSVYVACGMLGALLTGALAGPAFAATSASRPTRVSWMATTIAAQAHQTVATIEALKTKDGTWAKVAAATRVSPTTLRADLATDQHLHAVAADTVAVLAALGHQRAAQIRALEHEGLTAEAIAARLHLSWTNVAARLTALEQSRAAAALRNRAITGFLAQLTGKKAAVIAALKKKKGATWLDVAHALGLH